MTEAERRRDAAVRLVERHSRREIGLVIGIIGTLIVAVSIAMGGLFISIDSHDTNRQQTCVARQTAIALGSAGAALRSPDGPARDEALEAFYDELAGLRDIDRTCDQ